MYNKNMKKSDESEIQKTLATNPRAKKRDLSYEFIRVVAMLAIIFTHNIGPYLGNGTGGSTIIEPLLTVGVAVFFILSGKFAFKLNLEDKSLYKKYYWKKVIGLIIPMLVYMAIKNWHVMVYNKHLSVDLISYIKHFGTSLVYEFNFMEYWFLFILVALLIAVPFTARMMQNMRDNDKKAFLIVTTIMAALTTFIPIVFKVDFMVNYYFIGYVFFFHAGFIIEDIFKTKKSRRWLYLAGLLSFVATVFMLRIRYIIGYKSFSVLYLYFPLATFIALKQLGSKIPKKFEKIILFLGKHSLSIYMIHMMFLFTINDFNIFPINYMGWMLSSVAVTIVSLIAGVIIDSTIVKWLQKLTIKIFRLEKVLSK
jgi:peptidoglycan/LPS O-acetylase OafA/YrhL